MKKICLVFIAIGFCASQSSVAQCTSSATTYDLTVNSNVVLHPGGTSYLMGAICPGGVLLDSLACCTRMIHISAGATYEAGPMAYGIVYLKSGGTFNANGNNNFFNLYYEIGGTILNYSGPMTLCTTVSFPAPNCSTSINEETSSSGLSLYPNPSDGVFTIEKGTGNLTGIKITDVIGNIVYQSEIVNHRSTIDLCGIAKGIYFVTMMVCPENPPKGNEERIIKKIVID